MQYLQEYEEQLWKAWYMLSQSNLIVSTDFGDVILLSNTH